MSLKLTVVGVYQGLYSNFVLTIIPERNKQGGVGDEFGRRPGNDSSTSGCAHNMEIQCKLNLTLVT